MLESLLEKSIPSFSAFMLTSTCLDIKMMDWQKKPGLPRTIVYVAHTPFESRYSSKTTLTEP
jgi:hypothetical protein